MPVEKFELNLLLPSVVDKVAIENNNIVERILVLNLTYFTQDLYLLTSNMCTQKR